MSKIKKTALIGVVGASALTAGTIHFLNQVYKLHHQIKKYRILTKKEIKNQKIQLPQPKKV